MVNLLRRGFGGEDVVLYKHGEWQILLDTYTVAVYNGTTTVPTTYSRMRAPFINKDGLYFKIYRQGFFSSIGKFLRYAGYRDRRSIF